MKLSCFYFVLIIFLFYEVHLVNTKLLYKPVKYEDVGKPLYLTTLIETGKILEAKEKARVSHVDLQNIESYAGYFTVDKKYNSNLFFWYFPSQTNPKSDPVALWLQGGPGSTSLLGLFTGNGPIVVNKNQTLEFRKYSWNVNHNVIYIDSPVGAGYSFTDDELGYATNEEQIAQNLYNALNQFFHLFPELRSNEFFATGESYAGKYIPALCNEIRVRNAQAEKKINLVGLAIGNGWIDPINQIDYSDYLHQIGLLDDIGKHEFKYVENKVKDLLRREMYEEAAKIMRCSIIGYCATSTLFEKMTGFKSAYNYNYQSMPEEYSTYEPWIQRPDVRKAIHVGNKDFVVQSLVVYNHLTSVIGRSKASVIASLLENYRVLIYTGQVDVVCPYPLVENYLRHLEWSGTNEYKIATRKQWWIGKELAGYTKTVKNLTEVFVRNAGHMVPTDQPFWSWVMISQFTRRKPL